MRKDVLYSLAREGHTEIAVTGEIVAVGSGAGTRHRPFGFPEATGAYPARSLLKPFQFLAGGLPEDRWVAPERAAQYAAGSGSLSATAEQVAAMAEWDPARLKLTPALRLKGIGFPMDEVHRGVLKARGEAPRPEFHSCFSKHLCIVEACTLHGWPTEGYLRTDHPFHAELTRALESRCGRRDIQWVTDGCGLPSPVLTLVEMAALFHELATADAGSRLGKIRRLMLAHPEWIGGPKRVDTMLMAENAGRVIAKEGADGLLAVAVLPGPGCDDGMGIVVKLFGGYQPHQASLVVTPLLESLGLKGVSQVPAGQEIRYHFPRFGEKAPSRPARDISPPIGKTLAVFPGDRPFARKIALDTGKGDHLTLSSIETTVHIGAHTDAPNHFARNAPAIDAVALDKYVGACQVIAVRVSARGLVEPPPVVIRAPRVLFRTGSFPDPGRFHDDFAALSVEVVRWLGEQGVRLVGIDTPSIDPATSKDLPAHQETLRWDMGILEGIDLSGVEDGVYELHALPLRLRDADASPVRAVLWDR